ncbi:cation-dependent mannose-6-phosphate receptor-like [Ruditapes philippinarum]|uniref:cation-dependent mannose-6-phosphate receptor-like n=1 Tax=Ruditapes philippinarum TaxID=129788 RepID=UPI00295A6CA6|nr:cation-dependent mannose-6-phosphate receptor-like [Ruditapes philippinarum]
MKVKMNFEQFFIFIYCLLAILRLTRSENCKKIDDCSCQTSKGTVDLHKIPKDQVLTIIDNKGYTYQFRPCEALSGTCGDASAGVAVCQRDKDISYDVGDLSSVVFSGDPDSSLTANYTTAGGIKSSIITIKCDRGTTGKFTSGYEGPQNTYNFELHTQYACFGSSGGGGTPSKKISTGSVLLILFFVFLGIYFIGGMLFLKFARGAQGTEMVPNYDFWSSLPGYIKDGITFTCRGCKTESSYSQI